VVRDRVHGADVLAAKSTMSSGRIGTRVSWRPVAERTAAAMAGVEEMVGGSPTPRNP
jgi:hypothetical protein